MIVSTASTWQKKGRAPTKVVVAPMLEQPLGRTGHAPVGRIAQRAPGIDVAANLVDQRVFGIGLQIERAPDRPTPSSAKPEPGQ